VTLSLTGTARVLIAAAAVIGVPLFAWAQGARSAEDDRKHQEAEKNLRAKEKQLEASRNKSAADRERISAVLVENGKVIQLTEKRLILIEQNLDELTNKERDLRGQLEQRHGTISALLTALQRMGRNPPPVMITRREDALTMVRSAMLLAHAFPELGKEARDLSKTLNELADVIRRLRTDREERKTELARYKEQRVRVTELHEKKRQSEGEFQAELVSLREAITKVAKSEIAKLAKSDDEPSGLLAGIDKEIKAAAVLAPSGDRVATLAPGRIKPHIPFAEARGMLQLPAQGGRVLSFGQKTRTGTQSKGIGIQARHGGTVVSPCDGLIVYAAEFRTYGQVLIISAGGGYHILLAGLSQIDVQVGQSVLMGEPVGVMSSAVKSPAAQESGPVLTVEFRKDQRPIDPDPWWSDATRKG